MTEIVRPLRLAHRGDHRVAPENTLAAFEAAAADAWIDGVELDVRASRDDVAVVIHDDSLLRVQGAPWLVRDLDAALLEALGVPRLRDVLSVLPERLFVDIELKEPIAEIVAPAVDDFAAQRPSSFVVSSFDAGTLVAMRRVRPGWPLWLNADRLDADDLAGAARLDCVGISVEWHQLTEERVRDARDRGLTVAAWTVIDRQVLEALERMKIRAVCIEGAALAH